MTCLRTLGPWIANTPEGAEALLLHALALPFEHGPDVTIPVVNNAGVQLLKRYQFRQVSIMRYMWRGAPVQTQRTLTYAETSPAPG